MGDHSNTQCYLGEWYRPKVYTYTYLSTWQGRMTCLGAMPLSH